MNPATEMLSDAVVAAEDITTRKEKLDQYMSNLIVHLTKELDFIDARNKHLEQYYVNEKKIIYTITDVSKKNGKMVIEFSSNEICSNYKAGDSMQFKLNDKEVGCGYIQESETGKIILSFNKLSGEFEDLDVDELERQIQLPTATYKLTRLQFNTSRYTLSALYEYKYYTFDYLQRRLVDVLIGLRLPSETIPAEFENITFYNKNLNEDQMEAVKFTLKQECLALIIGPPGTGKTTTLVEIIRQEVEYGKKVIVCAPSNAAANNLTKKLSDAKMNIIRIGLIAKHDKDLLEYSIDCFLKGAKFHCSEDKLKEILEQVDVIISSLVGIRHDGHIGSILKDLGLRVVIIDESCQSTEAECWLPIYCASKLVLAGDYYQLEPTIFTNDKEAKEKLVYSLMERLDTAFKGRASRMLRTQYRMNEAIMKWSSKEFYKDLLIADASVKDILIRDLSGVKQNMDLAKHPLLLIDTKNINAKKNESYAKEKNKTVAPGANGIGNLEKKVGNSYKNEVEASIANKIVKCLLKLKVPATDIGVIAPYSAQVSYIKTIREHNNESEVATLDSFQGREKEVIIFSMTRSNPCGIVGFLKLMKRINVAITRAKRMFVTICNTDTICMDSELEKFIDHLKVKGKTITLNNETLDTFLEDDEISIP